MQNERVKPPVAAAEATMILEPAPAVTLPPETSQAKNQLLVAVAQYPSVPGEARTDIEEHLAELALKGVDKADIARALGSMFAVEKSAKIKNSILDELYALGGPFVFQQATIGVLPTQPLEVRDEAISILEELGDRRAIPTLQPLLTDRDENIREAARDAIKSLNNPPAP
jgi:uncharacterized protein (UPF0147 family)